MGFLSIYRKISQRRIQPNLLRFTQEEEKLGEPEKNTTNLAPAIVQFQT